MVFSTNMVQMRLPNEHYIKGYSKPEGSATIRTGITLKVMGKRLALLLIMVQLVRIKAL
jgi:hypothetical protein